MASLADVVALLVVNTYDSLPKVGKPSARPNGIAEWTILAGLVVQLKDSSLHCLSLATGVKCLSHQKVIQAGGMALHDLHAEVLVFRGFNRFLLDEITRIHDDDNYQSPWLIRENIVEENDRPAFSFAAEKLCLFVTGTPCGDASLDLLAEVPQNSTPWVVPTDSERTSGLRGHEYIWERGKVRFKPGRGDSPTTFSKSCSDKLALKSFTPASCYLDYLIVPKSAYHQAGFNRAFIERLKPIEHEGWPDGFRVQHIQSMVTTLPIPLTLMPPKSNNQNQSSMATTLSSIVYVQGRPTEVILGGVRMGSQFPPGIRGASYLSRRQMAHDFIHIVSQNASCLSDWKLSPTCTYGELKERVGRRAESVKHSVRRALGKWVRSDDNGFTIVLPCRPCDE